MCTSLFAWAFMFAAGLGGVEGIDIVSGGNGSNDLPRAELKKHLALVGEPARRFRYSFTRPKGERTEPFTSYAKRIGDTIHFWGDDRKKGRNERHGTLFAVYGFLETACGIRWVASGDDGIVLPSNPTCDVPKDWSYRFVPPLEMTLVRDYGEKRLLAGNVFAPRELRITDDEARRVAEDRRLWALRMRHQTRTVFKYGHAFRGWQKLYLAEHPEYFGLNPYGRRGLPEKQASLVKLCVSNEAVVDKIIEDWVKAGSRKYLNVCPNDGTPGYCFCENCRKLDADLPGERFHSHKTDRYLNFWNRIAAKARAIRPDVILVAYIYSYYRFAPRRERIEFPDNMLFGFVPSLNDDYRNLLKEWRAAGMRHFFLRPNYLCFRGCVTRGLERWLYDNFHDCLKAGAIGVDYDGRLGRPSQALEYYVVARMVAFPEKSFDDICEEFYSQYGAAAPSVKTYYERIRLRAERFFSQNAERMKKAKLDVLDDGELSAFAVNGHSERDLAEDLDLLRGVDTSRLSESELRRFDDLKLRAEQNLLTCRFLGARDDATREACARALDAFRKANRSRIFDEFGNIIRDTELASWKQVGFYREEVENGSSNPADPAAGWRSSFDQPGLDGWTEREAFVCVSDETASFDKYSVKLKTSPDGSKIGLWRQGVAVTPGAAYRLSFDMKLDSGVASAGMRVLSEDERVTLARCDLKRKSDYWQAGDMTFKVPSDCASLTLYVHVGKGRDNAFVYVDNIVLERLRGDEK